MDATDKKIEATNTKLDKLVDESVLTSRDEYKYKKAVSDKVMHLMIKHDLPTDIKGKLYSSIHRAVKDRYEVVSYKDLPKYKLDEVLRFISAIVLDRAGV